MIVLYLFTFCLRVCAAALLTPSRKNKKINNLDKCILYEGLPFLSWPGSKFETHLMPTCMHTIIAFTNKSIYSYHIFFCILAIAVNLPNYWR